MENVVTQVEDIAAEIREIYRFAGVGDLGRGSLGITVAAEAFDNMVEVEITASAQVVRVKKMEGSPFHVSVSATGPMSQPDAEVLLRCLTIATNGVGPRLDYSFERMAAEFLERGIGVGGG